MTLGNSIPLNDDGLLQLEEFVCYLYGVKTKSVNDARWKIFHQKYKSENKVPDLSSLPPCQQALYYHSKRSNLVAYIWQKSQQPFFDLPDISNMDGLQIGRFNGLMTRFLKMLSICYLMTKIMRMRMVNFTAVKLIAMTISISYKEL